MSTIIRRLVAAPLDIPLHAPFGIAGGAQVTAHNVLVAIDLEDGTRGHGEAAPLPAFNGETQSMALAAIERARGAVEGADAQAWRRIARDVRDAAGASASASCAIETAILDALTRRGNLSLRAFFGGAERTLVTDVTIPIGTREAAAREARAWEGFSRLKVKVGGGSVDDDVARVLAIHEASPRAAILLDGNGGLSADGAVALVESIRKRGVTPILFEQPVAGDDVRGLAEVARRAGVPIAADESACTARDVLRLARERAAHVVNVKIMKSGIAEALAIVEVAKATGLGLMIGGMVEAKLAMSTSACLAAGLGGFAFVDLDTPLFLAEERFDGGYAQDEERIDLTPIARGHGVVPREAIEL